MKVPAGKVVFSGSHRYKAGEELPAHIGKNLEKKLDKQASKPSYKSADKDSDK